MARSPRAPRLKIEVGSDVIAEAIPADSSHCMIAEAVKGAFPDAKFVSVDLQTIRFTDPKKGLRYTYLTPRVGQVALVNFDQGRAPEPFAMQLRNGQVTRAGRGKKATDKTATPEQTAQRRAALKRASLRKPDGKGTVPDKVGGRTPPSTPFARRRAFGLRALER